MNERTKRQLWISLEESISNWMSEQHQITRMDTEVYENLAGHMATAAIEVAVTAMETCDQLIPPDEPE